MHKETLPIMLLLAIFALTLLAEPYVQTNAEGKIAAHWNVQGKVDGWSEKWLGLMILPVVAVFVYALLLVIPRIEPYKKNFGKFAKQFERFKLALLVFMGLVQILMIASNAGVELARERMGSAVIFLVGLLLCACSDLIKHAKRNFFVGIKTPWTLASEKVWDTTHAKGAKVFFALGMLFIVLSFIGGAMAFILMIGALFAGVIYLVAYSYIEFGKEGKGKSKRKKR
ncbi:hypothetical protein COV61_03945 [Candidatus Micrarchaeota archaeon CG11_big_fil_rev_8_21_14_0_20_47_5]|nr:MAG: hypothetical protein AUJ17_04345 [Candidatus Micrarchaeota archaeon CG1_02_47_40]PIN83146.1 MAG: hypothetical protein COV61_03945 [Candidatus Micrarchaeota archaeon CG11_big_fil_rev_8_21_14_0_20_47_5]